MSDTPKKFPIPQIERAIHESLNPKGMSTHSGKVTLDVSWVQRLLILADQADLAAALAELANVKDDFDAAIEQRDKAIAKERERCAKVCSRILHPDESAKIEERANWYAGTWACAAAIKKGE